MRLLVDARPFVDAPTGGVGRVAYQLTKAYAMSFPNDHIVCATTGAESPLLPNELRSLPNTEHVHIRTPNKAWSAACMLDVTSLDAAVAKKTSHCDAAFFPNIGFFGTPQIRHALLLHDLSFLIEPAWFTHKQRLWHHAVRPTRAAQRANAIFAVSERTARDAERSMGIPTNKITVLPIGPTLLPTPSNSPFLPAGRHGTEGGHEFHGRFVLALGAGDARKNASTAIEAVRCLRKEQAYRDLTIIIVGRTKRHHQESWIKHVETPTDADMVSLYKNAAALLYPSWYEGYGLPLHEAASYGLPRVTSTSGALPETAPVGTLFADPAKPHHWAEALARALSLPAVFPVRHGGGIHHPSDTDAWTRAATLIHQGLTQ